MRPHVADVALSTASFFHRYSNFFLQFLGGVLSTLGVTPHAQMSFLVFLIASWMMFALFVITYRNQVDQSRSKSRPQIAVNGTMAETGQSSCTKPHTAIICYSLVVGPLTVLWVLSRTDQSAARMRLDQTDHEHSLVGNFGLRNNHGWA